MRLTSVDLNLLVYLDALLTEEHVTNAGVRLGLSQSATSRGLKRLRELFDDELLIKSHQGMTLTPLGQHLKPQVRQTLANLESLIDANVPFDPQDDPHPLTLSVDGWVGQMCLAPLLDIIQDDLGACPLTILQAPPHTPQNAHLHIGLTPMTETTWTNTPMVPWSWSVLHPNQDTIATIDDAQNLGMLAYTPSCPWYTQWQPLAGASILTVEDISTIPTLIQTLPCCALVPNIYARWVAAHTTLAYFDVEHTTTQHLYLCTPMLTPHGPQRWWRTLVQSAMDKVSGTL